LSRSPRWTVGFAPLLVVLLALGFQGAGAQSSVGSSLHLALPNGEAVEVPVESHRGFGAVPVSALDRMGWRSEGGSDALRLRHRTGIELEFSPGSPFLLWEGDPVQMVHAPYHFGGEFYLPVQLLVDLLPGFLPAAYTWDRETRSLLVEGAPLPEAPGERVDGPGADPARGGEPSGDPSRPPRVVVIDPGHGGHDTGAVGRDGTTEKEVALAVARALAQELSTDPGLEVFLTRDADDFVPLWERGARATEWKGSRPGVFLSIHANALPDRPEVRGFETYFLSEARTEHERRVAAAENAPLELEGPDEAPSVDDPLLAEIIRDLRTFDHQHWSALLAEIVQDELEGFHPGPNRGVKQGPFAVITNAMMPSVLIEVGFLTNRDEESLLNRPEFHQDSARGIARSVHRFFERYPPGSASR
jgi:N-acetylmuramoyl-L-alanine amidase